MPLHYLEVMQSCQGHFCITSRWHRDTWGSVWCHLKVTWGIRGLELLSQKQQKLGSYSGVVWFRNLATWAPNLAKSNLICAHTYRLLSWKKSFLIWITVEVQEGELQRYDTNYLGPFLHHFYFAKIFEFFSITLSSIWNGLTWHFQDIHYFLFLYYILITFHFPQ